MISIILATATRLLVPLLLLLSLFLLLRGHDEPGGGFIAGLVAASAFALHFIAYGAARTLEILRVDLHGLIGGGLLLALLSGLLGLFRGEPFLTGQWLSFALAGHAFKLSSVLIFDIGVYLIVLGVTTMIILSLAGEEGD